MKYKYSKYFFIGLFLVILLLAFLIVKELIVPFLSSIILAYFFYPVYKFLNRYVKNRSICSFLMILILILIVAIPLIFIIPVLIDESLVIYNYINSLDLKINPLIDEGINKVTLFFVGSISKFILTVPNLLINLFVTLFILFYLFKDGEKILQNIRDMIPLDDKHKDAIVREFKQVTNGVMYGLMLVGIIEGVLAAIAFYIFGVSNPIFWSLIIMILAILPALGASIVWAPLGIIKLISYDTVNGIGILIYGFFILSGIETFLRPKLIGDRTKLHPITIILGVIGGLKFFGFIGIIFGPFILVILTTMFKFLVIKK